MMEKQAFDEAVEKYYHLKKQKEELDVQLKELEPGIKEFTKEAGGEVVSGEFVATVTLRKGGLVADTAKMKKDGIFEKYSKERADSEILGIRAK